MKLNLTFLILALASFTTDAKHHNNFRGRNNDYEQGDDADRDLKAGSGGSGSGGGSNKSGGGGGNNRVNIAPACMFATPPNCVTWPLNDAAVNRATGSDVAGYTLQETVINQEDGTMYKIYSPDSTTSLDNGFNRVPEGEEDGNGGAVIPGTGTITSPTVSFTPVINRIPGGITINSGACLGNIPSIGKGMPQICLNGADCVSGLCGYTNMIRGVCTGQREKSFSYKPARAQCVSK